MNPKLKIAAYVVLLLSACWLGYGFRRAYAPAEPGGVATNAATVVTTNAASTNTGVAAVAREATEETTAGGASGFQARKMSSLLLYGAGLFVVLVGVGLLVARDVSLFMADRVDEFVFNDDGKGMRNPEYEHAEQVWGDGKHLEAIQLMRDYLQKNPREQYVALRIAEIYEKDLNNWLAAALEYEEVLKKKLPAERWGWAALRLSNLYSGRLDKGEQADALLHRVVNEYGQTGAAKKARQRLGLPEPVEEVAPEPEPEASPAEAPTPPPPESNLPKGFRPKKG